MVRIPAFHHTVIQHLVVEGEDDVVNGSVFGVRHEIIGVALKSVYEVVIRKCSVQIDPEVRIPQVWCFPLAASWPLGVTPSCLCSLHGT